MKYGLDVATDREHANPRVLAKLATEAEKFGWDGFFLWDMMLHFEPKALSDPWIALAAIAMNTNTIKLGPMVTPLARRRPWKVARETISLDILSNGRLILGVGLGIRNEDFEQFNEDGNPKIRAEKLDESLDIINGLWTGDKFSYEGKHYKLQDVEMLPRPIQTPRIPIWTAGFWPNKAPFRRAARFDGMYVGMVNGAGKMTPSDLNEMCDYVKQHRTSSSTFDVAVWGKSPANKKDAVEIIQPFKEAGATWWIEGTPEKLEALYERIRAGPPE
ncbi:MAG: LLM class flavin-dependent oxidoreductase [Candidatus Kariarchaeaceae archaeon]|jgi:alkanesulfonate monooxygenase SsuD/methylene tetrahydromethanopterin reductase-like flavin-dependent oxidoreductase (luciferase family)